MSNARRQIFVPAAFAGVLIWTAAAVHPAAAQENATPWTAPAARAGEANDCAASGRFDLHPQLRTATPERVRAPGGARLRPLVAAPCGGGPVARDV